MKHCPFFGFAIQWCVLSASACVCRVPPDGAACIQYTETIEVRTRPIQTKRMQAKFLHIYLYIAVSFMGWRSVRPFYMIEASHPIQQRIEHYVMHGCLTQAFGVMGACVVCCTHSIRPVVRIFQFYFISFRSSFFFLSMGIICKAYKQCRVMFHIYRDRSAEQRARHHRWMRQWTAMHSSSVSKRLAATKVRGYTTDVCIYVTYGV